MNKTLALWTMALANFLMAFTTSSVTVALPAISQEFGADAILLSWVPTAFILTNAICLLPFGKISDTVGIKKIFVYGAAVYIIASGISTIAVSIEMLIVFRALQGIGAAMYWGTSTAIISSLFAQGERGKALGIAVASVYLGLSGGPLIGGVLTEYIGWRSLFGIGVPFGLVIICLVTWKIKGDWYQASGKKFDLLGAVIYGIAIIALIFGFSLLPAFSGWVLILVAIIGLLVFIKWEMKTTSPMLDMGLFINNRVFTLSNLAGLLHYLGTYALVFLLSLYLQYIKGLSPREAGLILIAQPVVQSVLSPLAGRISDKIEPRIVSSLGMALSCIGLVLFSFLSQETPLWQIVIYLVILGLGYALFASPNLNAVMNSAKAGYYGIASAFLNTMRIIGQMLSMGITMLVIAVVVGPVVITPEYYPAFLTGMKIILAICSALCFAGIFASISRGKTR